MHVCPLPGASSLQTDTPNSLKGHVKYLELRHNYLVIAGTVASDGDPRGLLWCDRQVGARPAGCLSWLGLKSLHFRQPTDLTPRAPQPPEQVGALSSLVRPSRPGSDWTAAGASHRPPGIPVVDVHVLMPQRPTLL